jgi:hypothetical protein
MLDDEENDDGDHYEHDENGTGDDGVFRDCDAC